MSVFACVLPHLYSGVCCASVQCMCTFRGPDGDTMYSILGDMIHVQKAWYTNRHRISSQYKHAQVHKGLLVQCFWQQRDHNGVRCRTWLVLPAHITIHCGQGCMAFFNFWPAPTQQCISVSIGCSLPVHGLKGEFLYRQSPVTQEAFHCCSPSHCRGHGLSLVGRASQQVVTELFHGPYNC